MTNSLIIHAPCIITTRLLPGVRIGKSFVSIAVSGYTADDRAKYSILIDTPKGEFEVSDVRSGRGGGKLQDGLSSFFGFLNACLESGEHADLFSPDIVAWAEDNQRELDFLVCELEVPNLIEE